MRIQWKYLPIVLLLALDCSAAWARGHHHSHFGIGLGYYGPGFYGGYGGYGFGGYGYGYPYYYSPWYAYPTPVVPTAPIVPTTPPVYIERQEAQSSQPAQSQANYWYYCRDPDGYYPYVKNCPGGWLPVSPRPAE
ncbi:hypothetical protein [Nitrosomonas sp.]|uniref:hypothetical protein n=1 Tax=Nitrosomonas sp. TaxID=42353 RepID=UPI001D75D22C|nr:hypothetical protein [Nitrosomonas sp.]MBX3616317.1 hypothetical protein [Nitrosomonas sp.]